MRISSNITAPVSKISTKTKAIALSLMMLPAVSMPVLAKDSFSKSSSNNEQIALSSKIKTDTTEQPKNSTLQNGYEKILVDSSTGPLDPNKIKGRLSYMGTSQGVSLYSVIDKSLLPKDMQQFPAAKSFMEYSKDQNGEDHISYRLDSKVHEYVDEEGVPSKSFSVALDSENSRLIFEEDIMEFSDGTLYARTYSSSNGMSYRAIGGEAADPKNSSSPSFKKYSKSSDMKNYTDINKAEFEKGLLSIIKAGNFETLLTDKKLPKLNLDLPSQSLSSKSITPKQTATNQKSSKIANIQVQIDSDNQQIDEKNTQISMINSNISSQRTLYMTYQSSLDTIDTTINMYRSMGTFVPLPPEYYTLQRGAMDAKTQIDSLQQQRSTIEGEISRLRADIAQLQDQINDLNAGEASQ